MAHPLQKQLSPVLREHYLVRGTDVLHFEQWPWGRVHLGRMSLEKAERLVAAGFPYLKAKKKRDAVDAAAPTPEETPEVRYPDTSALNAHELAELVSAAPNVAYIEAALAGNPQRAATKTVKEAVAKRMAALGAID